VNHRYSSLNEYFYILGHVSVLNFGYTKETYISKLSDEHCKIQHQISKYAKLNSHVGIKENHVKSLSRRSALLFLRTPRSVDGKTAPRRLLRKTSNLFLFNYGPERIDHGGFNDSNFVDDV